MDTTDIVIWIFGFIVAIGVAAGFTETAKDGVLTVDRPGRIVAFTVVGGAFIVLLFFMR